MLCCSKTICFSHGSENQKIHFSILHAEKIMNSITLHCFSEIIIVVL